MPSKAATPNFQIGQLVRFNADNPFEAGRVLSITQDSEGFMYRISGREVDLEKKQILNGVKTVREGELEAVDPKDIGLEEKEVEEVSGHKLTVAHKGIEDELEEKAAKAKKAEATE